MENNDTIHLLKECDSGIKMAVASIDQVLNNVTNSNLKSTLTESKSHHEKLGNELHSLLLQHHSEDKEPAPIAKGMSWLKTNFKISMNNSDATIADLMTDGCDMGIKSLHKYKNQYKHADEEATQICNRLIDIEEHLRSDMRSYL